MPDYRHSVIHILAVESPRGSDGRRDLDAFRRVVAPIMIDTTSSKNRVAIIKEHVTGTLKEDHLEFHGVLLGQAVKSANITPLHNQFTVGRCARHVPEYVLGSVFQRKQVVPKRRHQRRGGHKRRMAGQEWREGRNEFMEIS